MRGDDRLIGGVVASFVGGILYCVVVRGVLLDDVCVRDIVVRRVLVDGPPRFESISWAEEEKQKWQKKCAEQDAEKRGKKEEFQEQLKSSLDGEHHRLFLAELRFQTDGGVRQRNAWMRCGLTLPRRYGRAR